MDRLFLDANVLFSAAYRPNAGLLQFWKLKSVILCSSHYAVEEARINLTESSQRRRLEALSRSIELHDVIRGELRPKLPLELPGTISLPEKDVPILLSAVAAKATHLVTGDFRHFGVYFGKSVEGILVISPAEYLRKRR